MELKKMPKNADLFYCEKCDFRCSKRSNYNKHLLTRKHNMELIGIKKKCQKQIFTCELCEKQYLSQSGLWKHLTQNRCILMSDSKETEGAVPDLKYKDMFMAMVDENKKLRTEMFSELKGMMVEIIPKMQPNNTTNNNTNIININMFLNEQCKDAMNISEFIESIQLTLEDMTKISQEGQTNGMSNILIDKLNELDVFKRPVHCSDVRTETIYVKDEDKWEMEEKGKPKLKNALDKLTKKSIEAMPCMEDNPEEYIKTVSEVLKDPREDKKIISKVAKTVLL
jgi:hypothetical protein